MAKRRKAHVIVSRKGTPGPAAKEKPIERCSWCRLPGSLEWRRDESGRPYQIHDDGSGNTCIDMARMSRERDAAQLEAWKKEVLEGVAA